MVNWARFKVDRLKRFLPFYDGIASRDTFSRVFSLLEAKGFEANFIGWMQQLCPLLTGQVLPIDGKSLRGAHDGVANMTHLVSAWHSGAGLVLGQVRTAAKSNEITAIPQLLDALDVNGATITIDAMGCPHEIVKKIVEKRAYYGVAVKNNQPGADQRSRIVVRGHRRRCAGRATRPRHHPGQGPRSARNTALRGVPTTTTFLNICFLQSSWPKHMLVLSHWSMAQG